MQRIDLNIISCNHVKGSGDMIVLSGNNVLHLCEECLRHVELSVYKTIVGIAMADVLKEKLEVKTDGSEANG